MTRARRSLSMAEEIGRTPGGFRALAAAFAVALIGVGIGLQAAGLSSSGVMGREPGAAPAFPKRGVPAPGPLNLDAFVGLPAASADASSSALGETILARLLGDPGLRARWEHILRTPRGPKRAGALREFGREDGFIALLERLRQEPRARAEVERFRRGPGAPAPEGGSRILVVAGAGWEPRTEDDGRVTDAPGPVAPPPQRRVDGKAPANPGGLTLVLLERFHPQERSALLQSVQAGLPMGRACEESGLALRCVEVHDACAREDACGAMLAAATGYGRDPVFALRPPGPPRKPPLPKAPPRPLKAPPAPASRPPERDADAAESVGCLPYGSLCKVSSDCWPEWAFDDCSRCCTKAEPRLRSIRCEGAAVAPWQAPRTQHEYGMCR